MRRIQLALFAALVLLQLAGKIDRLTEAEYNHYRALRIFMEDSDRKDYLKLKTTEERDQWLKDKRLWDKFYQHPDEVRSDIVNGDVELGWSSEMVYMAWGAPFQKQRLTGRPAGRSELFVYRFAIDKDGVARPLTGKKSSYKAVSFKQIEIILDDDELTEMHDKGDWR